MVWGVAFTPKGGCPLKRGSAGLDEVDRLVTPGSIHPQGWVPIETSIPLTMRTNPSVRLRVAFTPKGGCPLKLDTALFAEVQHTLVAFTPKGGCPLKRLEPVDWFAGGEIARVAFTPKGGCPLKLHTGGAIRQGSSRT